MRRQKMLKTKNIRYKSCKDQHHIKAWLCLEYLERCEGDENLEKKFKSCGKCRICDYLANIFAKKMVNSRCIVCCLDFHVDLSNDENAGIVFEQQYNTFCQHLIHESQLRDNWNWESETLPFCIDCKEYVDQLTILHEQQQTIHRQINNVVSSIVSKVLVQNNNSNKLCDRGEDKTRQNLDYEIEKKMIVVDKKIIDRVETVRRSICKSFQPTVVLTDGNKMKRKKSCQTVPFKKLKKLKTTRKIEDRVAVKIPVHVNDEELDMSRGELALSLCIDDDPYSPLSKDDPIESADEDHEVSNKITADEKSGRKTDNNKTKCSQVDEFCRKSRRLEEKKLDVIQIVDEIPAVNKPSVKKMSKRPSRKVSKKKKKHVRFKKPKPKIVEKVVEQNDQDDSDSEEEEEESSEEENDRDEEWIEADTKIRTKWLKSKKNPPLDRSLFTTFYDEIKGTFQYGTWMFDEMDNKLFKCLDCGRENIDRHRVPKHVNAVHILKMESRDPLARVTVDENGIFHYLQWTFEIFEEKVRCRLCGVTRKDKTSMVSHINQIHNTDIPRCDNCRQAFATADGLKNHICHPLKNTATKCAYLGDGKYMYDEKWPFEAMTPDGQDLNTIDSLLAVKFKCSTCEGVFTTDETCKSHIRQHHIVKNQYCCEICGYSTTLLAGFNKHQATHSSDRHYMCELCGKAFKSAGALRLHKNTHSETTPSFACDQCDRVYTKKRNLSRHRISSKHFKSKNEEPMTVVQCPKCERFFRGQPWLDLHLSNGNRSCEKKIFNCHLCPHKADTRKHLNKHLELVHNLVNFKFKRHWPMGMDQQQQQPPVDHQQEDGEVEEEEIDTVGATEEIPTAVPSASTIEGVSINHEMLVDIFES